MPPPNTPVEREAINTPPSEPSLHLSDLSLDEPEGNMSDRSTTPPLNFFLDSMLPSLPDAYTIPPYPSKNRSGHMPKPETLELVHEIEPTALSYVGEVDENLICSICRAPFSDPRITSCGHVFCYSCLLEAVARNGNQCPTDRRKFESENPEFRIVRLLRNQVDALLVECPTCSTTIQRSDLARHLAKFCPEARVACPGQFTSGCERHILRKQLTTSCLHFVTRCDGCGEPVPAISMTNHLEEDCSHRMRTCADCWEQFTQKDAPIHEVECPRKMTSCKWSVAGCQIVGVRYSLPQHEDECSFRFVGHLFNEIKSMKTTRDQERKEEALQREELEKKVRELESRVETLNRKSYTEVAKHNPSESLSFAGLAPELEHVAALFDDQKTRIDKIEVGLKEVEARNTTLVFNENLAIQNELIELRSLQQTTSMHVRWLLQFRLQENRRNRVGTATGLGGNGGGSDNGGSDSGATPIVPRRSSDSLHEPPRL